MEFPKTRSTYGAAETFTFLFGVSLILLALWLAHPW
jgi:hypothetical protein